MAEFGTIDREVFQEFLAPHLGADRADVPVGPRDGVTYGVVDVDEKAVAMATDPIVLKPSLGFERTARYSIDVLLSDVAVSGLPPSHLAVDFTLPPGMTDAEFETVWETVDCVASEFDVAILTGHTGRYAGCNFPMVGAGTALAVGDRERRHPPNGARVGDRIVVTKGPAVEATALLAGEFESLMREGIANNATMLVDDEAIDAAIARFDDVTLVADALTAAGAGPIHAMTPARDGGVYGGLFAMAAAAGVGIRIDSEAVPVQPGVLETCAYFGVDPWTARSQGTLLAAVAPTGVEDVLDALDEEGIPAADVGEVTDGEGLVVDGDPVDRPSHDPFWDTLEEYTSLREARPE